MEQERGGGGASFPSTTMAPDVVEADTTSGDDEQSETSRLSEIDPYDYTDIADRFYACEIEEIPSFRWMTPSQREVGPSDAVDRSESPPRTLQRTPKGAERLRIEMDNLVSRKMELENHICQFPNRRPKQEVERWFQEVEKQRKLVDILLTRRRFSPFFLSIRFQLREDVMKKLNTLDELHQQLAEWGDDDRIMEESTELDQWSVRAEWQHSSQCDEGEILQASNLKCFAFKDLCLATRNFRTDSLLGEGGFGSVFKGWVDEQNLMATNPGTGTTIAVKRLKLDSLQGVPEWLNEIRYLSRLRHPNIVRLLGYCMENDHRMLVYEFVPRGSLDNHLFRRHSSSSSQHLSWNVRMKTALGAAKGLAFLHSLEPQVILRGIKPSDILLDMNYDAKLCDFGLARDGPRGDDTHVSTRVMGTVGYAAPEYTYTGHLTTRCDVYGFGVVLLELLTGRRAVDRNRSSKENMLVPWVEAILKNLRRLPQIIDPRFEGQYSLLAAKKVVSLALGCVSSNPKSRPIMDEVVSTLDQVQNSQ